MGLKGSWDQVHIHQQGVSRCESKCCICTSPSPRAETAVLPLGHLAPKREDEHISSSQARNTPNQKDDLFIATARDDGMISLNTLGIY